MEQLLMFAQEGSGIVPVVRLDYDDLLDVLALVFLWLKMRSPGLIDRVTGNKNRRIADDEIVLHAEPDSREIEVAEGTGPLKITMRNGTVRVEPWEDKP